MTACKFFLEGRCTFGDRCRNEHPRGGLASKPHSREVCRFFRQGNCRYGSTCKFYHPDGRTQQNTGFHRSEGSSDRNRYSTFSDGRQYQRDHQSSSGRSQYFDYSRDRQQSRYNQGDTRQSQHSHGNARRQQQDPSPFRRSDFRERTTEQPTSADIRDTISYDMDEWERSGIWQLSSYALRGNELCIGKLEEYSQEEIRWEAYQAKASGRTTEYQTNLTRLLHTNKTERSRLTTDRHTHSQLGGGGLVPQGSWPSQLQQGGGILSGQMQPQQSILSDLQVQSSSAVTSPIIGPGIFVNQQNQAQHELGVSLVKNQTQQQQQQQQPPTQPTSTQQQQQQRQRQPQATGDQVSLPGVKMSEEDLLQFKADKFTLGKVPEYPPPQHLC